MDGIFNILIHNGDLSLNSSIFLLDVFKSTDVNEGVSKFISDTPCQVGSFDSLTPAAITSFADKNLR